MKTLIVIIGTMLLGVFITSTLILGSEGSLQSAAEDVIKGGIEKIEGIHNSQ